MLRVYPDYERLSAGAAETIIAEGSAAFVACGRFDLVLSGGRTPRHAYELLAKALAADPALRDALRVWWADERCVPPDDPRSNFRLAKETLLDPAGIPDGQVFRIRGEEPDADAEAARYAAAFPRWVDLVVLGMGADGHTASLFAHSPALWECIRRFTAVTAPVEPSRRITLTPAGLSSAPRILVLVSGVDKAPALARVFSAQGAVDITPARLVREALWILDAPAYSGIS